MCLARHQVVFDAHDTRYYDKRDAELRVALIAVVAVLSELAVHANKTRSTL